MKKIIERKNVALENLYNKMNTLIKENHELKFNNNKSILDKKIELLKSHDSIFFNNEIDKLLDEYIFKSDKVDISLLIELGNLYYEERNREKLQLIINKIIDEYLNGEISEISITKVIDLFDKVNINKNKLFKIINKVINNGLISKFKNYIINNKESLYIFKNNEDSMETIKRIIDVLIINQELELQLGYKELFKVMNNYLSNIEVNNFNIEIYFDIKLLSIFYGEYCNALNDFDISSYEYSEENELLQLIISGINELYFDEYKISKLSNHRQEYLISKIIKSTLNLDILLREVNNKDGYSIEFINNDEEIENKIQVDNIVESISLISDNEEGCKICSGKFSKESVWLGYYKDKNQEEYNGVIPAKLLKCDKCNKYYAAKGYIEALEKELDGNIIIIKQY